MKIIVLSSHTQSLFWFRLDMMKSFKALGHEVVAVGSDEANIWGVKFLEHGIKYRQIYVERNGINPLADLKTLNSIKKIFLEENPDKVFAYQAKSIIYGSIAAKKIKNLDFYSLVAGLGSIFRGEGLKNKILKTIMSTQYKIACKNSKLVFFQNNDDKAEFINNKIINNEKTAIINGSGVNMKNFTPEKQPAEISFLFIGRLIKDKGIMEYLEASKVIKQQYPNIRCLLVGPYDSNPSALKESELQPYIENGYIEYYGEQKDVRTYLKQVTTFVLPSYHEGTPKTILEAMAMNRSIITTDAPGCRETVEDGKNGLLVQVGSVESLVDAMKELINTPQRSVQMGDEGLKIVRTKYDVELVNKSIQKYMGL